MHCTTSEMKKCSLMNWGCTRKHLRCVQLSDMTMMLLFAIHMLGITLCWAHITETGADYFVSKGFPSLRRQKGFVLQIRIAGLSEGGIDLISSQGIIQLMKITNGLQYHFFLCIMIITHTHTHTQ